jgi:hypothetical protein
MLKGSTKNREFHLQNFGGTLKICIAFVGVVLFSGVAIEIFLHQQARSCSLMPGMCKKNNKLIKSPFQQLDEGFHGRPKFGLTSGG